MIDIMKINFQSCNSFALSISEFPISQNALPIAFITLPIIQLYPSNTAAMLHSLNNNLTYENNNRQVSTTTIFI